MATQMSHEPTTPTMAGERYEQPTAWVGWIYFASVMMIIAGALNAIYGLIALVNDAWVVWGNRADLYLDLTTWGWMPLILGGVVLLAGIGLLSGNVLARGIAVFVASLSIVANFLFMPAYPVWALTIIAIDVFVIFALTAHGRELR